MLTSHSYDSAPDGDTRRTYNGIDDLVHVKMGPMRRKTRTRRVGVTEARVGWFARNEKNEKEIDARVAQRAVSMSAGHDWTACVCRNGR